MLYVHMSLFKTLRTAVFDELDFGERTRTNSRSSVLMVETGPRGLRTEQFIRIDVYDRIR